MIASQRWNGLVQFGFRLLYHEMAWTYDFVSWGVSLGQWRAWQRAALRYLDVEPGTRVLELAHGTGNLQIDLRTAGLISVGCDLSSQMGRIARRKLARHRIAPVLVQSRAQQLPFSDACFSVAISTFPTEFIIAPQTLHEVYRVLQPGGRLVIVPEGLLTGGGLLREVLEWAYRVTGQRQAWPDAVKQRFAAVGFQWREETVVFSRSEARVIIAQKREN